MKAVIAPLAVIAMLVAADGTLAARPSFDCGKAQTADEHAICGDDRLSELDQAGSIAYGQVDPHNRQQARSTAKEMLSDRRACGPDKVCILDVQAATILGYADLGSKVPVPPWVDAYRIDLFQGAGEPPASGLPKQVGRCALTKIASISTRFGDELRRPSDPSDSSGSAISYANKGYQISYEFVPELAESRIGDDVLLCLIALPKNCPPGDDRGKIYSGTNLRTKGSWLMPDAQHGCGGA